MAKKPIKETIHAKGIDINIYTHDFKNEYVSLTDIAKYRSIQPSITVHNWLRGRDIVEFLGLWETLHNPDFKLIEFERSFMLRRHLRTYGYCSRVCVLAFSGIQVIHNQRL